MFKSLAVAALLCNVSAEAIAAAKAPATTLNDEPSKDFAIHFGSLFTTGFLRGSKVGDIYADDFVKCLEREDTADHIFNHGNEEIEKFLRTKDADVAADALNTMIYFIIDLAKEKNQRIGHPICEVFDQKKLNYKEIDFAIGELMNPETGLNNFMGKLYFNRQNIDKEAVEMLKAWELKDYEKFGFLLGETLVKHEGEDPKLIEERFGSEFAVGFLKGARVGDVQITELFKCLEFEPKADEIFRQANMDIGKMFKNRDKNEGVKGLDDLIRFVIDMAMEKAPSGQHKCEAFGDMDLKYDDLKKVLELLKAPESTMKMEGGHFTFNGANLDREADWMVHEYVETNFIGFGYALGDTLAKHDGLHPHNEVAKTTDAKDTKVAGRTALTKVEANNTIEWGSKFTAGFLAGGNVGKINWEDFVHCLDREEKAVEIFVKAEEEIKKFFEDKDEAAGVEGLKDMVKFVTDLATERNQKYGHPTCEVFEQTGLSYEKLDKALHEFYDPDTTLMYQNHKVYFNRQDIDWEAEHMVAKLKERDLIGFGYELGFSMIAHSGESPKLEA
jgi:predicted house-cleaning noncanonical NTP pyrophosphatase (MazG superfamily)